MFKETISEADQGEKREKPEFLYHGTDVADIKEFEPRKRLVPGEAEEEVPSRVYGGDNPAFAAAFSFPWKTDDGFELSFDNNGKVVFNVPNEFKHLLNQPAFIYKMPSGQFEFTQGEGTGHSYHSESKIKPVEMESFPSVQAAIEHYGGIVNYYERNKK